MAIIVEDGTLVEGANSYVSRADAITYATARGVTLSDTVATDVYIIQSFDEIETSGPYNGYLTSEEQVTQFPREELYIDGILVDSNTIPTCVIKAQCELIIALHQGYDPSAVIDSDSGIKQETMGPFSVTYKDSSTDVVILPKVSRWLSLVQSGGGNYIQGRLERSYG